MKTSESNAQTVTISKEEYEGLKSHTAELEQQLKWVMEQLGLAKKRQFGSSSEKSIYGQIDFFNEAEAGAQEDAAEPELYESIRPYTRKKGKRGIESMPEDLPVEVVEYTLSADDQNCPKCGNDLHVMGKEVREELKIVPARAVIVRHICYVYSCRACEKGGTGVPVTKAPMPKPVIKGSFASPEAVAHIAIQKYVMSVPLYRQEQEWKRARIELSRQTMSNWLVRASRDWLEPLYNALRNLLLERDILHADETTLQVLHELGKIAQSKSYMWLYRTGRDDKMSIVLFDYQPDRSAERARAFLDGFSGYLHTDGYEGYHRLSEKLSKDIVVVGCWAHARRKFDEALKVLPKDQQVGSGALHGKQVCDQLFAIERHLADLTPEERLEQRQELAKPVQDEFYHWLKRQNVGSSTFGRAVKYTLGQWKYLENYLLDGRLEISNNRAENSIRPFTVGRKNWLFANTPNGARASAILYSIIETAKQNDLDPYRYLTYIFTVAPNCDLEDPNAVAALLPDKAPDECRITTRQTTLFDEN